ncbi:MAG: beta-ketoacyl synthase N-terminal-like domain-containing protein [Myxococcota bacterium]
MRLAITGAGSVSPFGVGRLAFEAALATPEEAPARAFKTESEALDASRVGASRTAEVWGWDPAAHLGKRGHRSYDRLTKFLIAAAKHALADAGIKRDGAWLEGAPDAGTVGICSATAYGSLDAITELNRVAELEAPRFINPSRFPNTVINAAAGYVSIWEGLEAPNTTIVDGNCGALDAVLAADTHLINGRGKAFLVGGGEVVSDALHLGLSRLEVLAPPDGNGPGLTMGEGACYLVMERETSAKARGARVLGRVLGYGNAFEPPEEELRLVDARPEAVERALAMALAEAGLEARSVDVVASARGGLARLDDAEAIALERALPGVPVAAPKRLQGETFGAAGAFSMASALAWMAGAPVAPIVAGEALKAAPRVVAVTAVGFYGNASAVVLAGPEDAA